MQSAPLLFDEERHHAVLESLSLKCLADGKLAEAYRYADRRCRVPPLPEAHHYTLRGEISYRMGYTASGVADISRALSLAPNDLAANRRMLAWGSDQPQIDAARRLVTSETDFPRIAAAIAVLRRSGERNFASVNWTDRTVTGWAVWDQHDQVRATIESESGDDCIWLVPDPAHPLAAEAANAAGFSLARPRTRSYQFVSVRAGAMVIPRARLRPNMNERALRVAGLPSSSLRQPAAASESVSVIVPVYADFEATVACFDSLMPEIEGQKNARLIIVDDASQDLRIVRLVRDLAKNSKVSLLRNEHNLGFAGAVNRALATTRRDDVLLLNADTVVPPDMLPRLAAVAYSAPDIGTVTPLSNNGELTSFPVPFRSNPLCSYREVCDLDAVAARVNASRVVELPNGIGFCLYVTRACLDAVVKLSDAFARGYFEDVDLCLRAREFGFRNVCATSVYVGHAGSRSFGGEKDALVAQNLETIKHQYPAYRSECAAFVRADPLRSARAAIEYDRALPKSASGSATVVLITGPGRIRPVVEARAKKLAGAGNTMLLVETSIDRDGPVLNIAHAGKALPQSLSFRLAIGKDHAQALDYLQRIRPARIEIADPAKIHLAVLDLLLKLDRPIDLFVADAGVVCPRGSFIRSDGVACDGLHAARCCDACLAGLGDITELGAETIGSWEESWARVASAARHIYAPDPRAASFAAQLLGRAHVIDIGDADGGRPATQDLGEPDFAEAGPAANSIGFAAIAGGVTDYRLMRDVASAINRELPERPIVVIGETIDDIGLMRLDNVHVTGNTGFDEHDRILRQYGVGTIFIPTQQPLFGHPRVVDLARRRPAAFFDWSFGAVRCRATDLALSPYLTGREVIASLLAWLAGR